MRSPHVSPRHAQRHTAHAWGARRVLGVDIDDTLVRAAWKRRRTLWSLQSPNHPPPTKRIRLDPEHDLTDYFPLSCEQSYGPLPIPDATDRDTFPHNVAFRTADFLVEDTSDSYDVVIAYASLPPTTPSRLTLDSFSITKWIHLNHGDKGVTTLFRRVYHVLKPGGTFLLEPQSWETYAKARRMDSQLRENARQLRLRPQDFPALLAQIGFGPPQHLGTTGEGGAWRPCTWGRVTPC